MFTFQPPLNFLKDKTVMITGASDGIGKCCALHFAQYGANLILLGRSKEKLEEVYDLVDKIRPDSTVIHPLDFGVATEFNYKEIAASLENQFFSLDGLVHSAGILGPRIPIEFYSTDDWDQTLRINVSAAFLLTKYLLPFLKKSEDARVLFTSSSVGRKARGHWGAYAVSKFALEGLMQVLADELGKTSKIRINSLNPGGIRTAMRRTAYPAENPSANPPPEVLMPLYLYLFSSESKNINGQALDFKDFDPSIYSRPASSSDWQQ